LDLLRRYTNLASFIHMAKTNSITLLNPATWDDRNDAYFMAEYKRLLAAETVLALCFTSRAETYHHWHVFSHGSDGVCIEFVREKLLWTFEDEANIRKGRVNYRKMLDMTSRKSIDAEELAFLKRHPYLDEGEYRIVYVDREQAMPSKSFDIDKDCIHRVVLSPWMPKPVAQVVRQAIRELPGCENLSISISTLVDNEAWKQLTSRVPAPSHRP